MSGVESVTQKWAESTENKKVRTGIRLLEVWKQIELLLSYQLYCCGE